MTGIQIYNLIKPHLGNINATGFYDEDMKRLENYKIYDELISCLLEDLDTAWYRSKDSNKSSARMINERAKKLLLDKADWLDDYINE